MMISSNRKGVRSRSARMTARALSHRQQVRRKYMTTAASSHPCGVCEDCPDRPLTAHPFRSSGTQDRLARDPQDQRDDELHRPPGQGAVRDLSYFSGYRQARGREVRGIPLGTVKLRTLAALRKLQGMLKDREG